MSRAMNAVVATAHYVFIVSVIYSRSLLGTLFAKGACANHWHQIGYWPTLALSYPS